MYEEAERLGISKETFDSMKRFFLKHSVPRLIERKRAEEAARLKKEGIAQ